MGCLQSNNSSSSSSSLNKNNQEEQLYYDPLNNLISFDSSSKHIQSVEVNFISSHDQVIMKAGDECYIISTIWLNSWLEFAKGKTSFPKSIDNKGLIEPSNPRKLKKNIIAKKDYRPVCKAVWEFYFIAYGGGPVILFHVPSGLEEKSYKSGDWLKYVKMHEIVSIVYPESSVDRISFFSVSNPMTVGDMIAKDNSEIVASHMMQDLGKNKIKQAQALQADINAGNAEAIGALMAKDLAKQKMAAANELTKDINAANADLIAGAMAKDLGDAKIREAKQKEEEANKAAAEALALQLAADMAKKQMEEARKLEEEANKAAAEAIANQLAADMAKKQMEEARKLEEEANKAAAEAIANQLAADMAKKQMEEARKKEEEANKAAAEAIANQLAADMAKKQMEEARKLEEEANKAAAEAIANQFAADMAKKQMEEARELERKEREEQERRLMESFKSMGAKMRFRAALAAGKEDVAEEAAATMLQGAWRSKVAKRKMEEKRLLKIKLREEACARKLQSTYRARLARKKAAAIRAEKQRLMEEACARKLQCKYRSRLARKKVLALRAEKQRLMEEACARRLQCKYRSRLARKKVEALRAEKQRLMEEACARRLQCKYRSRLARKKVEALRAEKQRLMEEACARRLQCKYRSRLARKKVEALRAEKQRLLEEGCAIKLQGAWRIRKARKKVEALKAERQRLREEACAIKLQSAWRIRKARARVAKLKAEKQRLLEEGAALMLQGAWRIRRARQRVNGLKRERGGAIKLQRLWKTLLLRRKFLKYKKSSVKVEKLIRGYLARKRMAKLVREFHPHNIVVTLQHAKDLNIADVNTSDPYVIVSAHRLQSAARGGPKSTNASGELFSYAKSKVIANTLNPTWNEDAYITSAAWNSQVALTVMDSDMVGAHDFLGQTTFLLPMIQSIYSGTVVDCRDTPLNSYEFTVSDGNGKPVIAPGTSTMAGKGTISFTIRVPSLAYNMCGYVYKNSSGFMSGGALKKRWMILVDFKLRYYESQFTLDEIKGEINCSDITSLVEEDSKKEGKTIKVSYGKGKDHWIIKWDPDSPKYIQQMWYRKLIRCCPNVPDRELLSLNPRAVRACTTPSRPPAPLSSAKGQLKW